jgi:hypothetical protein
MKVMQIFRHVQSLGTYIVNSVGSGHVAEARAAVPELLKLYPGFSIGRALDIFPMQSPRFREQLASVLRHAGLPE